MSQAVALSHGEFGRAVLFEIDRPFVTHAHREGHLVFYLEGGNGTFTVGDQKVTMTPEAAVAISPWEPHSFDYDAENDGPHFNLTLYIKPMWFLENSRSAEYALSFGRPKFDITPRIAKCVQRLTAHLLKEDGDDTFDGLLFEITRLSFEESWRRCETKLRLQRSGGRFTDYRVRRSVRLMQEKFGRPFEIDQLAREVGLSRPHFFKLFRKQMGVTPNIYLNTLRAEQAIEDLLSTNKSVTDIAYDVGFSSQASFTRFFSSNVGIAPSEYRRIARAS